MMLDIDPKLKKKRGAEYFERPEDLDDEWVKEHQAALVEEQRQKIRKKFEKDNEKLAAEGQKEMKPNELEERLQVADDLEKKFKHENKTGKVEAEGKGPTIEKMEANLEKLTQRIETMKVQKDDKDNNKEVALGTSKIVSPYPPPSVVVYCCSVPADQAVARTILILVSPLYSLRNSMSRLSGSFPRRCARSSIGQSSLSMKTGNSKS